MKRLRMGRNKESDRDQLLTREIHSRWGQDDMSTEEDSLASEEGRFEEGFDSIRESKELVLERFRSSRRFALESTSRRRVERSRVIRFL